MNRTLLFIGAVLALLAAVAVAQEAGAPAPAGAAPAGAAPGAAPAGAAPGAAAGAPPAAAGASPPTTGAVTPPTGGVPDPLNTGATTSALGAAGDQGAAPVQQHLDSSYIVQPGVEKTETVGLGPSLDNRIKQTKGLLDKMVWQLNRETAWANSVHDIIQNYQYKYTKVLSQIKKHAKATKSMRDLLGNLNKARLHQGLEEKLSNAIHELTELASASQETSDDAGSYAAIKDRVQLMLTDLSKMTRDKVNKPIHAGQHELAKHEANSIPPASQDLLNNMLAEAGAPVKTSF